MSVLHRMMAWGELGLSGHHHLAPPALIYWHARLMVVAWTLMIPSGMLIARFFKVTSRKTWPAVLDRPFWWRNHLRLQVGGVALAGVALILAFERDPYRSGIAWWHECGGWALLGWAALQVLSGALRGSKGGPTDLLLRGDHYDMTRRRLIFEYVHKFGGWCCLGLAVTVTIMGLVAVDAPRWMALLIGAWWSGYLLLFAMLQRSGRCIDTYQAIWGPNPAHPGNARRAIGWGVRRHVAEEVIVIEEKPET